MSEQPGTLYLVATPIGNLEDITLRALRILREVTLIAAEDTRHSAHLLHRYEIMTRCISYHEHNVRKRLPELLAALRHGDVALISDAGTPAISDPGQELVQACIAAGIPVVPIPGPNAPVNALIASGMPTERFLFFGFPPRHAPSRRELFQSLRAEPATLICFEAPHRLIETLEDLLTVFGDRQIAVANDLTKLYERFWRMPISAALAHFQQEAPRGEFTLVVAGAAPVTEQIVDAQAQTIRLAERLAILKAQGVRANEAVRLVMAETGLPRRAVYEQWLALDQRSDEEVDT